MPDPETALVAIILRMPPTDRWRNARAMHTALSELLDEHQPDSQGAYCRHCYEPHPCDVRDTIATALGGVEV